MPSDEPGALAVTEAQYLLALWEREELAPEEVPGLAVQALENGCESQAVAVLAGTSGESRRSIEDLLPPVMRELGLKRLNQVEAAKIVFDRIVIRIAAGDLEPVQGARQIWRMLSTDSPLWTQLRVFVGLASECEDDPGSREYYEAEIVRAARKLVARGGIQI